MYTILADDAYLRRLEKFLRAHPNLRQRYNQLLIDLENDPHQPHLRLHALQGTIAGHHAVRLTYQYRVVLILTITDQEILLVGIGSHDAVYG